MTTESKNIEQLLQLRTNDLSEPLDLYLQVASEYEESGQAHLITRAEFIRQQCNGISGQELFDKHRESWGIPFFDEDLLTADDFKRGFLWKFRDHTTSWSDNQLAKKWFLTSAEARFVRRYELWNCDNGNDECSEVKEGSYKEILFSLLTETDFEVLTSPALSKVELQKFFDKYDGDYSKEELIEMYVSENPNW